MAGKRIIAVVGSTGAQGGSVARALLRDPSATFDVRALTRTPESEAARNLARLGAEVLHLAHGKSLIFRLKFLRSGPPESDKRRLLADGAPRRNCAYVP